MEKFQLEKGLVQVYTGEGKGKTSTALGVALRAIGHGLKVCMIQFLKGSPTGELNSAPKLAPYLKIEQWGRKPDSPGKRRAWVRKGLISEADKRLAQKGLKKAQMALASKEYDIVILDEVNVALYFGFIQLEQVLQLIKEKPSEVELILTGRRAAKEVIEAADLVTKMVKVKHPFDQGIEERKGIDY